MCKVVRAVQRRTRRPTKGASCLLTSVCVASQEEGCWCSGDAEMRVECGERGEEWKHGRSEKERRRGDAEMR